MDVGSKNPLYKDICDEIVCLDIRYFSGVDIIGDAHNLPFKDESVDNIIMTNLLEHVPEPQKVISEAYRVLKKGGTLIVSVPFMYPIHGDPHDYWRFTNEGLEHLLRNFKILKITKTGGFFTLIATYLYFLIVNLKLKFLLPLLNIFIFLDRKFPWIFKRTACGFLVIAKKIK